MSGFAVWARGPGGTLVVAGCLLVLAVILAYLAGRMVGERRADERHEEDRAEREAARARPVYRQPWQRGQLVTPGDRAAASAQFDAIREAGRRAWAIQQARSELPYRSGTENEALALVRDDLTDSAYTADMAARMDRFLEGLCGVPYSADELWSGQ